MKKKPPLNLDVPRLERRSIRKGEMSQLRPPRSIRNCRCENKKNGLRSRDLGNSTCMLELAPSFGEENEQVWAPARLANGQEGGLPRCHTRKP